MDNFDIWAICFAAEVTALACVTTFLLAVLKMLGAIQLSWVMVFAPIWVLSIIALIAWATTPLVMWLEKL